MMTEKPISIVSLGPGDPELLTVGALHDLQRADVVFCPTTVATATTAAIGATGATGAADAADTDIAASRAGGLLLASGIARERIRLFALGMCGDRRDALATYDAVARAAVEACDKGLEVAIAAEGDAGIFASVHYVGDRVAALGHAVRYRAGIPSFIAAGATAGLHLVRQRESLLVVPELRDKAHAEQLVESSMTVVFMKLSQNADLVRALLAAHPAAGWHYFENVGSPLECHLTSPDEILARRFPYFSLLILRP